MKRFFVVLFVLVVGIFTAGAANAWDTKFSLTTTSLSANDTFGFYMSASGTFYVDCGDGGTLSGDGVSGDTITRTGTTEALYTCTYSTGGVKTIRMGGVATGYNTEILPSDTNRQYSSIRFGYLSAYNSGTGLTPGKVSAISGSIGQIFPTLGTGLGLQPVFFTTFAYTPITSIPENLFNGVTGQGRSMFSYTFYSCTSLTSIPERLFVGITGGGYKLFDSTFCGCSALTSIPEGLFASVIYSAGDEFMQTFAGCTSLTSIPGGLFSALTDTNWAGYMFYATFSGCSSLTSLPNGLFSKIKAGAGLMFVFTFQGDTSLSGYIPPSLFSGLIEAGSPNVSGMWYNAFAGTQLATTCPAGTVQYITGYEDYWDGHVSCRVTASQTCAAGTYLPAAYNECTTCAAGSYCTGGTYDFNASAAQGITACGAGLYSPAGMSNANQCGHILHIGDATLYLHGVKKTTPAMHVRVGNDIFYGNMTTADVPMNVGTTQKLKVKYGGVTYSIYDDTVNVN